MFTRQLCRHASFALTYLADSNPSFFDCSQRSRLSDSVRHLKLAPRSWSHCRTKTIWHRSTRLPQSRFLMLFRVDVWSAVQTNSPKPANYGNGLEKAGGMQCFSAVNPAQAKLVWGARLRSRRLLIAR